MGLGRPTRVSTSLEKKKPHERGQKGGGGRFLGYPLPQSEADELVPAGLEEVLDVFFPAQTHTSGSQIN